MKFRDFLNKPINADDTIVYSTGQGTALVLAKVIRCETYDKKPRIVVNRYREGKHGTGSSWFDINPAREVRLTKLDRVLVVPTAELERVLYD